MPNIQGKKIEHKQKKEIVELKETERRIQNA